MDFHEFVKRLKEKGAYHQFATELWQEREMTIREHFEDCKESHINSFSDIINAAFRLSETGEWIFWLNVTQ